MIDWEASGLVSDIAKNKDRVIVVCEKCSKSKSVLYVVAKRRDQHICMSCIKRKNKYKHGELVEYKCIDCGITKSQKYSSRYCNWRCHHCAMVYGHKLGKFKITHNSPSEDGLRRISEAAKANWQDPEYVKKWKIARAKTKIKRSKKSKEIWSDPERLHRLSESIKEVWQDPTYYAIKCSQSQELWQSEEYCIKHAASMASEDVKRKISRVSLLCWQDPEYRKKVLDCELSDDTRKRLSEASTANNLARWADPEHREQLMTVFRSDEFIEKMSGINKQHWEKPGFRENIIKLMKERWQDPEYRDEITNKCYIAWQNRELRERAAEISRSLWSKDEYRSKVIDALAIALSSVEYREIQRHNAIKNWNSDDYRANVIFGVKKALLDPVVIAKISESSKKMWANPDSRAYQCELRRLAWKDPEYREKMAKARASQSGKISSIQKPLYKYLDDLGVEYYEEGPETKIGYYVFDCRVVVPDKRDILIECQGDYWHSLPKAVRNDRGKFTYIDRYFPEYEIIYVWEHEFSAKDRVLDRLKLKLGVSLETVDFDFRNIELREVSSRDVRGFLDAYHYIGKGRGGKCFGAYHNGDLVACCVFSSPLRQNIAQQFGSGIVVELSRLCIHPSYHKKNFASWFIARALRNVDSDIVVAYADTTVGHIGTIYRSSNFELHHNVPPDYWYVDRDGFVMHKRTLYGRARRMSMGESDFAGKYGYVKKWGGEKLCFTKYLR